MKKNTKKTIETVKRIIFGITVATILSIILYFSSYIFMNIVIYKEDYVSKRDFTPAYIIMGIYYLISIYILYIRKQSDKKKIEAMPDKFDPKETLISYFKDEGKILLIIYGILAVVNESRLFVNQIADIIVAALLPSFAISHIFMHIPILRTILGFLFTMISFFTMYVLEEYRRYRRWNKNH